MARYSAPRLIFFCTNCATSESIKSSASTRVGFFLVLPLPTSLASASCRCAKRGGSRIGPKARVFARVRRSRNGVAHRRDRARRKSCIDRRFARHRWHQRLRCDADQKSWRRFNRSDLSDRAGVSARAREARSNTGDIVSEILNWSSRTKSRDPTASPLSYRLVIPSRRDGEGPHSWSHSIQTCLSNHQLRGPSHSFGMTATLIVAATIGHHYFHSNRL